MTVHFPVENPKTQVNPLSKRSIAIILDDHELFAASFSKVLEDFNIFRSIVYFTTTEDVIDYIVANIGISNDYFLFVDYHLKDKTTISLINDIKRISKDAKLIAVTASDNPTVIRNLVEAQVSGILHKSCSFLEVLSCVEQTKQGYKFYSPSIKSIINAMGEEEDQSKLSPREIEIISLFSKGYTVDETAKELFLSRHTVAAHRRKIYLKTGSNNIADLLHYARKYNLI